MNCKVENTENANEVKLEITVDAAKFEDAMKKVYFKNAKYINIPGFRKIILKGIDILFTMKIFINTGSCE